MLPESKVDSKFWWIMHLFSSLGLGQIKVKNKEGVDILFSANGGFVEVRGNKVVVLVESAERADQIDVDRAKAAQGRAEKRLQNQTKDIDVERARAAQDRALNRLRVATKA